MSLVQTTFIAGHGKLPSGSAAKAAYDTLAITVEIELKYSVILTAECTLATRVGRDFVSGILRGYSLREGVDPIVKQLNQYYHGAAKAALIAALKDLESEYSRLLEA